MENKDIELLYPDTDYTNLILKWGRTTFDIFSVSNDGEVEFALDINERDSRYFYLNQKQIKALIEHLHKQLK